MPDKNVRVGFIGLGLMGNPMAKNIHKSRYPLIVYNRNLKKLTEFKKLGISIARSPKELASQSDVVITMVTGPKDVRQVLLGKNGVAEGAKKGLIVIDMSTIGKKAALEISEDLQNFDISFVDAPVTGSVTRATDGTLTIFIGAERRVYTKVEEILKTMGTNLQYMGPVGMGQAIKLVNNLLVAESLTALAEGMLLADSMGLSRMKVAQALDQAMVTSPLLRGKMPNMVKEKFQTAFSLANMDKDLKLSLQESQRTLPVLKKTEQLYTKGVKEGLGNDDNSAILQVLEGKKTK